MRGIIIKKNKGFPHSIDFRLTCEAGIKFVYFLFTVQDMADLHCDKLSAIIPEAETQRCYLAVGVGAGYHLNGIINTKNTFHRIIISYDNVFMVK